MFQVLKDHNYHGRLLYSAKVPSKIRREIKAFHNENRLEEFMIPSQLF